MISWAARSRWTKPMWAAGKPASWGDRRRPSRSSRLRRKSEGGALAGSEGRCEEPDPVCPNNRGTVRTDGWSAYSGLANQGYDHQPRSISASGDPAHIVMECIPLCLIAGGWASRCHRPTMTLSRRVHFPIQSPPFAGSWPAFLPTAPAGGAARAGPLQGPSRRSSQPRKPNVGDTRAKWIPSSAERVLVRFCRKGACAFLPKTRMCVSADRARRRFCR